MGKRAGYSDKWFIHSFIRLMIIPCNQIFLRSNHPAPLPISHQNMQHYIHKKAHAHKKGHSVNRN